MTRGGHAVGGLQAGGRLVAGPGAIDKVPGVAAELVELAAGIVPHRRGPEARRSAIARGPGPADRLWAAELGYDIFRCDLGVGRHDKSLARDGQAPSRAAEFQ